MEKSMYGTGPVLIVLAGCFWGSMGIFVRKLTAIGFSSAQIVSIRVSLAALFFSILLLVKNRSGFRIALRDLPLFFGLGFGSILFFTVCYFTAITMMPLSAAAILLYTSPIWIMLMSVLFFHEKLNGKKLLALYPGLRNLRRRDYGSRPANRPRFRNRVRFVQHPWNCRTAQVFSLYRHNIYLFVCGCRFMADLLPRGHGLKVFIRTGSDTASGLLLPDCFGYSGDSVPGLYARPAHRGSKPGGHHCHD